MNDHKLNNTKSPLAKLGFGLVIIFLFVLSFFIRYQGLKFISWDLRGSLFPWYEYMSKNGVWESLSHDFSNYTPPYLYLLGIATLTKPFLNRISGIKGISLAFDLYNVFIIYKILGLKYKRVYIPLLAGALAFLIPSAVLNSSFWAQSDSIYTAFLLTSFFFILRGQPFGCMLAFSLAFAFKLQAVFFLPFLLTLSLQKKLPWKYYLLIPSVYLVMMIPSGLAGRPWLDLLTIYLHQTQNYSDWTLNAASLYVFIPAWIPESATLIFLLIAGTLVAGWMLLTIKKIDLSRPANLIHCALASTALVPFILPRMHDRYFYPAEILSFVLAFYKPRLWFLPLLFQASALLVYNNYLFQNTIPYVPHSLHWAAAIMALGVGLTLWTQFRSSRQKDEGAHA
jgi:Gpi18-like mannosyltransferase